MSVMDSDPFEHPTYQHAPVAQTVLRRAQQQRNSHVQGQNIVDRNSRSAFKKRDLRKSGNANDDIMGQNQSSAEYIDVFDVNPHSPYKPKEESQFDVSMRSREARGGNDLADESEDYSYAYSSQISRESISRLTGRPLQRSVTVKDDYSVPPDRLSMSSGGVPLTSPDYIEPYKDTNSIEQLNDSDNTYELAKDIDAIHAAGSPSTLAQPAWNRDSQYSHLNTSAQFRFPNNRDISEESYDHVDAWQSKSNSVNLQTEQASQIPVSVQNSNTTQGTSVVTPMMQQPGDYQEPWDTEEEKLRFSQIIQKAEQRDEQRKSIERSQNSPFATRANQSQRPLPPQRRPPALVRITPPVAALQTLHRPTPHMDGSNTYESAWDNERQQRKLSGILQTAQSKGACTPPASSLQIPSYSHNSASLAREVPADYEDAWDLPEKQREFEESLQRECQRRVSEAGAGNSTVPEHVPARVRAPAEPPPRTPSPILSPVFRRILNTEEGRVPRSDSCRSLGALAEKVDATIPLEDQTFYHGSIKRTKAERMLVVFKDGSYLVRRSESKKQDFSLTLKGWNGLAMHLKISHRPDGMYVLGENSQPFPTIPEMIHYYTTHELPVHNAERICLLYPVPC